MRECSAAVAIRPGSKVARFNLCVAYQKMGEYAKALKEARTVQRLGGALPPGYLGMLTQRAVEKDK